MYCNETVHDPLSGVRWPADQTSADSLNESVLRLTDFAIDLLFRSEKMGAIKFNKNI